MSDLTHEEQAKRILQKYDPKMVRILPSMMKKFEGKEAQLVSMLVKKHGPVPTDAELAELNSTTTTTPTSAAATAKPPSRQPSPKRTPPTVAGTGTTPTTSPLPGQKSPNARPRSPSANQQQQQPGKKAPPPRSPPTTTTRPENNNNAVDDPIEAQCKRLLEKYDPKMVKVLPSMMKKFEGKEQSLLNMLVKKHGPVPPPEASSRPSTPTPTPTPTKRPVSPNAAQQQQPKTPPRAVSPQKRPHSASTASASSKPAAAVPPPPQQQQQQQDTIEAQCKRLLEKYDPKMVKVLPSMMKKFEGKEQSLLNMLVKKHGPVPPLEQQQQQQSSLPSSRATTPVKKAPPPPTTDKDGKPLPSSPPSTTNNRQSSNNNTNNSNKPSIEDQVRAILEHKDAKMVKVLPSMMKKFEGKEQTLLNMMCKKHNVTADQAYQWASGQHGNNDDEFSDEEEEEFFEEEEEEEEEQQEHQRPQPKPTPKASTPQTVAPQQQQQRPRGASTSANQTKPTTTTAATTAASPSDPNFIQLVLNAHNTLRQKHNAPPLQYDTDCEASAKKCANHCQQIGKMEHSFHEPTSTTDKQKHGQNLYWHSRKANVEDAVNDWYSEIHNPGIDFENPEPAKKGTGHASQVLWKGTTRVGAAFSDDGKYFVCNYFSAGNVRTKYKENLSPSISTDQQQPPPKEEVQQQQQQQQRPRGQSQSRPRGASTTVKQHQEHHQQLEPLTPQQLLSLRSDLRIRLLRYFQHHDPAKILAVDAELNKYFNPSSPNPEQDFWRDLGRHYPQYGGGADPRTAISSTSPDRQLVLDRIRRMYVHYDPTVLSSDLPAAMKEFGNGREIELLKILIKRYGPEPENLDHLTEEEQEEYYQSHSSNASQKPQSINNITAAAVPLAHRPAYSRLTNPDQRRAFNMYRHYDPLCLEQQRALGGGSERGESQFDRMMKQYHGQEFEWVEDLKKIYGPEPIPKLQNKSNNNVHSSLSKLNDATARGNSLTESETHRRIRNMYQHYDPDEMRNLPIVLERYSGDEPKLLKDLITRYGPEPPLREVPDPEVLQQRAANVVSHYDPESSGKVPELLQRFKGREDQLLRTLVRRYGPEPLESLGTLSANEAAIPPTVSENIAEIRELVSKHEPESAPAIPGLLQRYSGKEETLLQLLRQRYGTSILVEDPTTSTNNNNNNNSRQRAVSFVDGDGVLQQQQQEEDPRIKGSVMSIENRIRRILEANQPDVVSNPEAFAKLMKEHEGKEDEYLKELVALHGPEPEISSTTNNKKPKFDHPKEASARQKLTALFTHYDRMQLPRIDEWLENYTGREDQMLADVHKKYALPPPQEPPVWIQPLQKLCLAHGMQETFLEKLISSMGSAATKDNVTFELLNIWYPDFVSSLLTDEGQRRTLTAKRLARFLSVVAPGRVPEVPEMLHQVVSGGQSSDVVLGDMLLTFYRDAMMNAVVPRLDHSSLREKDDAYHQSKQQQEGKSVGAGFIGNVEQLKKLLDVWHQQRHHTRTVPQLLGTSATDLIRFPKVLHRAVGPDELLVKPVRTLGTDTETDSGQVYGSGMPMDGRTLDHDDASSMRNQSQKNNKKDQQHQNEGPSEPPPNPLLFSRFGIKNEDIPRTRWGCPNCEALRDFTEQNESRWQARFKEQEVKLWKLLQEQTNRESQTQSQQQQSASPPQQQQQQQPCNKCPILNKEIENLRHRVHQLQTRYDNRAALDSAVQQYEKEQQQQQQRNADGTSTTPNSSQQQQLQRYATPRRLFQIEHPAPVATNRYNYLSQQQQQSSTANRDLVPLYHTNATSPSSLRQPSSTLQRSQELWSTLYNNNNNNSTSGNNDNSGGGVILPSSEAAKKVLSML